MPASISTSPVNSETTRLARLIAYLRGAGSGLLRTPVTAGKVTASTPATASVIVAAGDWVNGSSIYSWAAAAAGPFAAPTGGSAGDLRRKDTVQFTIGSGVNVLTGTDDPAPSAPAVSANSIKLAEIHCRTGMTTVKDADDAANGFVVDSRVFV